MSEEKSSYRQIIKATSIFGGVQAIQIILQIIKSKLVAILIGPSGLGIIGLLQASLGLISKVTNLGLETSSIKEVAEVHSKNNNIKTTYIVNVSRKLFLISGLLGTLICFFLAPLLSEMTFGNKLYTSSFRWLSISLLFTQLSAGQKVALQGFRKIQFLAKANLFGSFLGLLLAILLYFYFGLDAIVAVMVATSIITTLLTWFFFKKLEIPNIKISYKDVFTSGSQMIKMGVVISLSGVFATSTTYILRLYIFDIGGVAEVGLFTAGFAIINTYVGLIFTAMGTDYYPRLSEVAKNNKKLTNIVNQQSELALLILGPILVFFMLFLKYIVYILYSSEFIGITTMLLWAAMGMYFKAVSWCISYIFLAKSNRKIYLFSEFFVNLYLFLFNIIFYKFYGLEGLGIAFAMGYLIFLFQVYFISKKKYSFILSNSFLKLFSLQLLFGLLTFLLIKRFNDSNTLIYGILILIISIAHSIVLLNKKIDLLGLIKKKR